jgi:uncharacterized membrane protein
MNRMLVAVFNTEAQASEGLTALEELHNAGDITLYGSAVLLKDGSGKVSTKRADEPGPLGTAVGAFAGSMAGLIAGPVGVALGSSVGMLTGLIYDLNKSGIDIQFVDDVSTALSPGKAAVLADVEEGWTTPVDARIAKLGGIVFRRMRHEVIEDQLAREAAATEAEVKELKDELSQARAENKAEIQQQIDSAKKKLQVTQDQIRVRIDLARREAEDKIAAMREQLKRANDRQKARIEKRMAELKSDLESRTARLEAAAQLAMEALAV